MGPRHQASCAVAVAAIKIQVTLLLDSLVLIQENMYATTHYAFIRS